MNWNTPWVLAFAAALIPLVIAFLNRRKVQKHSVSSLILLRPIATEEPSHSRFALPQHLVALILSLIAFIALLIAIAQPLPDDSDPKRYIFVIDTSSSMGTIAPNQTGDTPQTRLDNALNTLESFLNTLPEGDEVALVTTGPSARVLLGPSNDLVLLREQLAKLTPSGRTRNHDQALRLADALCGERGSILLLSDQITPSIAKTQCPLHIPPIEEAETPGNLGITVLTLREVDALGLAEVYVEVYNNHPTPRSVSLNLLLDGQIIEAISLIAPGKESIGKLIQARMEGGDVVSAELVDLKDDALAADNIAYASRRPAAQVTVLLVTQNPEGFTSNALRLHPRVRLTPLHPGQMASAESAYDLIILEENPDGPLPSAKHIVSFGASTDYFDVEEQEKIVTPKIVRWAFEHEIFRFVELDKTRIDKARALIIPEGGISLIDAYEGAIVISFPWEKREVLFFGFRPERSDLVLRVSFANIIANIVEWSEPHTKHTRSALVSSGDRLTGVDPSMQLVSLHETSAPFNATARLNTPGVFKLLDDKQQEQGRVAVNLLSPKESDVQMHRALPPFASPDLPSTPHAGAFPWQWILFAALLILAIEWLLAPIAQLLRVRSQRSLEKHIATTRAS